MKFWPSLMRLVTSQATAFLLVGLIPAIVAFFGGPAPSDIPVGWWGLIGGVVTLLVNVFAKKIPEP